MSLELQPDTETLLHPGGSWILPCVELNLSYFLLSVIGFSTCLHTLDDMKLFAADKKCGTGWFEVRQDDGEPSLIPCFYIPVLLPVQSSMHGWTGPTLGRSHPARQGSPGCVGRGDPVNLRASQSSCIHPWVPHRCTSQKQIALRIYRRRAKYRHAMLTLFSSHYVITQLASTVSITQLLYHTMSMLLLVQQML